MSYVIPFSTGDERVCYGHAIDRLVDYWFDQFMVMVDSALGVGPGTEEIEEVWNP